MSISDADNTWAWKGVPYAKAPVGKNQGHTPKNHGHTLNTKFKAG